ncbi:MAG: nuclease-related domain-containing protein [Saccharospirillum sp.]|uniref:nuclease-related domain-containing protein n=1 Tax=Saccharospirillum sp. TaxID=2033801 RepID=UPI003298AD70
MKAAKQTDPIDQRLAELEEIHAHASKRDKRIANQVKGDILKLKAGHSAEKNAAYMLDKLFLEAKYNILLHDLRLESDGDVAQIDHLFLNRFGFVRLYETKSFSTGMKIDDAGVFWRWDGYGKQYIEIPSPILQSQRHEVTLKQALKTLGYDALSFSHYVLVDYKARLIKPNDANFDRVCRPDRLEEVFKKEENKSVSLNEMGILVKAMGRLISGNGLTSQQVLDTGKKLAELHKPLKMDVWSRYGLKRPNREPLSSKNTVSQEKGITEKPKKNEAEVKEHLSSSKAARRLKLSTLEFLTKAESFGLVIKEGEAYVATEKAQKLGVENKVFRNIPYVSWPVPIIDKVGGTVTT